MNSNCINLQSSSQTDAATIRDLNSPQMPIRSSTRSTQKIRKSFVILALLTSCAALAQHPDPSDPGGAYNGTTFFVFKGTTLWECSLNSLGANTWTKHGSPGGPDYFRTRGTPTKIMADGYVYGIVGNGSQLQYAWWDPKSTQAGFVPDNPYKPVAGSFEPVRKQFLFFVNEGKDFQGGRLAMYDFVNHSSTPITRQLWHGWPFNRYFDTTPLLRYESPAVLDDNHVFAIGTDGKVEQIYKDGSVWRYAGASRPGWGIWNAQQIGAMPEINQVFVTDYNGQLWDHWYYGNGIWSWFNMGYPPSGRADTTPAGVAPAKLFINCSVGSGYPQKHLCEAYYGYWSNGSGWLWVEHGIPPGSKCLLGNVATDKSSQHVYSRGLDNNDVVNYYQRSWGYPGGVGKWVWINRGHP